MEVLLQVNVIDKLLWQHTSELETTGHGRYEVHGVHRFNACYVFWEAKDSRSFRFHVAVCLRVWTRDVHMCTGYKTLWAAVINRQQKGVDVQGVWESPTVSHRRQERVGSRADSPYRNTPTGSPSHTLTHALRSQAELSCFNTDLLPAVEETVHRYEIVAS